MAQKQMTMLIDDITGEEISQGSGESIQFAINSVEYRIDLNDKNARKFHEVMAPYIDHATRVVSRRRASAARVTAANDRDYDPKAVRKWADANKVDVPARGRIPGYVLERFKAEGN